MLTVIVFILILGLLIFVHELGHFLVARRNGIKAEEFGFGFPPRMFGAVRDESDGKLKWFWGKKHVESKDTIYSMNWIPLGGFVKIKGEEGAHAEEGDSFAGKSAWIRIKVLAAGVTMNFVLAWFLISLALMIGAPQAVEDAANDLREAKIQISEVLSDTPAEKMGLKIGDEIIGMRGAEIAEWNEAQKTEDIQNYIKNNKGKEIILKVKRGNDILELKGVPRLEYPKEQGPLGIGLVRTALISYPWYEAIWKGLTSTLDLIVAIIVAFFNIIKNLILGAKIGVDISGPVGIAVLTKQVTTLGFVYILQFAALLSINLGIINILPIPALDGGRILFVLIEKIKGSPVSHKVENIFHTIGFALLIALMIFVTAKDLMKFDFFEKIKSLF